MQVGTTESTGKVAWWLRSLRISVTLSLVVILLSVAVGYGIGRSTDRAKAVQIACLPADKRWWGNYSDFYQVLWSDGTFSYFTVAGEDGQPEVVNCRDDEDLETSPPG